MTVDEMANVCQSLRWRQLVRPSVRRSRVFDTGRLEQFLAMIINARDFDDLDYVSAAVACDRATRERVLLSVAIPSALPARARQYPGFFRRSRSTVASSSMAHR